MSKGEDTEPTVDFELMKSIDVVADALQNGFLIPREDAGKVVEHVAKLVPFGIWPEEVSRVIFDAAVERMIDYAPKY
jgi:hypothetical protein